MIQNRYSTLRRFAGNLAAIAVLFALAAAVTGCAKPARRISETESITTVGGIDIQDWNFAATELSNSLVNSGVLERAPRKPAVMAISRIVNNTTQHVDTDLLTKTIRETLLETGKVETTTTMGLGGYAEDPMAKGTKDAEDFYNDKSSAKPDLPDYTLSGKLIELRARAGNIRQSTFAFQLSLTDTRTGRAVWEKQKQITKQGSKSSVGF